MPAQAVAIGTGTTVTFGTSSYPCNIRSISHSGLSRAAVSSTHLGTTVAMTKILGKLYDPGTIELEIFHSPNDPPPLTAVAETVTITTPIPTGGTTAATVAASMGCTGASVSYPLEDAMVSTITLTVLGTITFTDST